MENTLDDAYWGMLLTRIQDGECTPFLGAGINEGILSLGSDIAQELAEKYEYPLEDSYDLARVTQFVAITTDWMFSKKEILRLLKRQLQQWEKTVTLPDFFKAPDEPLGVLAELPFPIYMTTNYDDLMVKALEAWDKAPKRELCRWNKYVRKKLKEKPCVFDSVSGFEPTPANPVVFHLHGHDEVPESLVLTENCYVDFMVNSSKQPDMLPFRIQEAMTGTSLLFIGYRLDDWDFRVLFQGLVGSMEDSLRCMNMAVQLVPGGSEQEQKRKQEYLIKYFDNIDMKVYWGTAKEFAVELRDRWTSLQNER